MSMNFIAIHGRLVRDPESRHTQSGVSVCNFTVAVDSSYSRQGEEKQTTFFDVVCWRGLADMVSKYFHKGKEIVVTGEMQSRKWQDKDGNNRVSWEIMASSVDFCGSKGDSSNSNTNNAPSYTPILAEGQFEELKDGEVLPF